MTLKMNHRFPCRPSCGHRRLTSRDDKLTIMIAPACLLAVLLFRGPPVCAETPGEVDQTDQWERHLIDAGVHRDHGHSVGVGDLNGDGRPDALIAFGERHTPRPTDGVYWYEAPRDPRASRWTRRRLTDPALPIRWCMALTTGDVDNDGDLDVVALSFNRAIVYLAINPLRQRGDLNKPWQTIKIFESSRGSREPKTTVDLSNRQRQFLQGIGPEETFRTADYAAAETISLRQARRELAELEEFGLIEKQGKGRATVYRRTSKTPT